jgi:hypothetical protein
MEQEKKWYFYGIFTKTIIGDKDMIYIGITTNPQNKYYDHQGSSFTNIIKNFTKGVIEFHVFPIELDKMKKYYAELLETLLVCIMQYNYPNIKIYGGVFNRIDCDVTQDKIIEKFKDIYKCSYDNIFYKHYNDFINKILNDIKLGQYNLNLTMPVKYDSEGNVIMWEYNNSSF